MVPVGMSRGEPTDIYYETKVWTPDLGYDAGDSYDFGISTNNNAMKWRLRDRRQVVPTILGVIQSQILPLSAKLSPRAP